MSVDIVYSSCESRYNSLSSQSRHGHTAGPLAKKDKPVSREDFVAMVSERLMAVQKDREHMRKRAQEQARQQGRCYEDIIVSTISIFCVLLVCSVSAPYGTNISRDLAQPQRRMILFINSAQLEAIL